MKRLVLSFIFAILCGISVFSQVISAVCESGQTLKYIIYTNTTPSYAVITYFGTGANGNYNSSGVVPTGDLIIPSSVTYNGITYPVIRIVDHAFDGCSGLTSVIIPNSIPSIGEYAFSGCSGMTSVTIPSSVTNIGRYAFDNCRGLTAVYYAGTIAQWCGITFGNYSAQPLYYAHNLYINNSLVTDLVIPNTITGIYGCAFDGATCLTSVSIPSSVTSIGSYAFANCRGLTEITIPNSVTVIGSYAFANCSGLTEITIPNSVTYIGSAAFGGCRNLTSMTIPFVGYSVTATEASASTCFGYIFGTESNNGGTAVVQSWLTNVSSTVTYYIPYSLKSVTITGGRLFVGAFHRCSWFTSITLPDTITSIPPMAFRNCSSLRSITIPSSVTNIGQYAFQDCSSLTNIYANPTTPPSMSGGSYATFNRYTATVWVPCGSLEAYQQSSVWSNFSDIRERFPYTLNVSSADLTMGTASVTQQPTCTDATAIITATPNNGYAFQQWNDGNTDNPRTISVTDDGEYIAYFGALYTITLTSADETMGTVSGGGTYLNGEQVEISAVANEHYHFVQWNDGNTDNPRTITVTGDATYIATFAPNNYTIVVRSLNDDWGTVSEGGTFPYGTEIQISATPAEHYHFTQWNDGNSHSRRRVTVTSDSTFIASFAIDQHTVTVVSADSEMGTVSEGGTYDYGTEIQISATPAEGYGFAAWNDGNTDNPRTITVTEDITYTATFGAWRTITVLSADETLGTVSGSGVYAEGAPVEISAEAVEHYHFAQWNDGNTDNPRTIIVTGDAEYTAYFGHNITIVSADETMGTVSGSGTYPNGEQVEISAVANEHYHFVQWNDGNTDNPRTITVTGDATYIATFAPNNYTIVVRSLNEERGTVSGGGTFPYGTETQISATPADGFAFVAWTDGNTDNPRTITVIADAEYVAAFTWSVGIDETAVSEIALFPNPATDILNITSSETISEIEIVNVMGQVVKRIEVNADNAVCDVEDLKAGVYVVRIHGTNTESVVSQQKFIKE